MEQIVNKVAESGIITLNLEEYYPNDSEIIELDLKNILYEGLILREKDLREFLKNINTEIYAQKYVWLTCSADAIIPNWAFMLTALALKDMALAVIYNSSKEGFIEEVIKHKLVKLNLIELTDKRIVIKGCSNKSVPIGVYVYVASLVKPIAKSLMYGEPCSTVPLYKKRV